MSAKLEILSESTNPLSIVHVATEKPFYYVEDAVIDGLIVTASFYDENDFENVSEFLKEEIAVSRLTGFIDEFYSPGVIDLSINGYHEQHEDCRTPLQYLKENLRTVVADYLNTKGLEGQGNA